MTPKCALAGANFSCSTASSTRSRWFGFGGIGCRKPVEFDASCGSHAAEHGLRPASMDISTTENSEDHPQQQCCSGAKPFSPWNLSFLDQDDPVGASKSDAEIIDFNRFRYDLAIDPLPDYLTEFQVHILQHFRKKPCH